MCVAVPISEGSQPKGILLGGSAGVQYIEPPAAVGPNNDLAAARGEVSNLQLTMYILSASIWQLKLSSGCAFCY
jgi:hypothetical protein